MTSYQIVEWGAPLAANRYRTPEPTGTEVLLRVTCCGVCHSDLHIRAGYFDMGHGKQRRLRDVGVALPLTLGHEPVGEVAALGPDAAGVAVGDRRVCWPWVGCRSCASCQREEDILCERGRYLGARVDGGFSDYLLVPHPRYLLPYDGVEEAVAATYACAGITAYAALKRAVGGLTRDDTLLLVGAGGLGTSGLRIAPAITEATVVVADTDPAKRALAERLGAAQTIDNGDPGAAARLRERTGGVAASVDFVGMPQTTLFAIDTLRRGCTHVVVGLYGGALDFPMPNLIYKLLSLRGSHVGTPQDLAELIALRRAGRIEPPPITERPLSDADAVLTELTEGRIEGRVVLRP